MKNAPRYILPTPGVHGDLASDLVTYEFPIARENLPSLIQATLVVNARSWPLAVAQALNWAQQWTKPEDKAAGRRAFPVVRYGSQQRLVMQVNGVQAYAENRSRGGWLPLGSLSV